MIGRALITGLTLSLLGLGTLTALTGAPAVTQVTIQPDPVYTDSYPLGAGTYADPDGDFESGSTFRWLVNDSPVLSGTIPQTLLAHFDGDLATTDGELPDQTTNITYAAGRWGQGLLFSQDVQPVLAYNTAGNFDKSESTVEFWVQLLYDLDDPHYDIYNYFFRCRMDPQNAMYVEANGHRIIGVVQRDGNYHALWPETPPGWRAGEWYHVAMTWSAATNQSRLYYDGVIVAVMDFTPPPGTADRCYVGSDPWGNRQAEAVMDELRLSGRALSEAEIRTSARQIGSHRNGEVLLPPGYFYLGDQLIFEYTPCDGVSCGAPVQSPPVIVAPVPLAPLAPAYEHLPSGTITFTLSLTTSAPADCRWGPTSTPYADLPHPFTSGQGTVSHTTTITGLTDLATLSVYVRCADQGMTGRSPDDYERHRRYRVLGPFNPGYPRVVKLWGGYDPGKGLDFYARHDLVITNDLTPADLAYLRSRNPHLKVLYTLPGTYGRPLDQEWEMAQPGDPTYPCLLRDSQGQVLYVDFWGHPMFNMTNQGCVDRIVDYTRSVFDAVGYDFDGLFYDRLHDAISWLGPDIDADLDGQPDDPTTLDAAHRAGVSYFLAQSRAFYPHIVIAGNDAEHLYNPWVNGREYEWQIGAILDHHPDWLPWGPLIADYQRWSVSGPYPQVTFMLSTPSGAMRDKFGVEVWGRIPPAMLADAAARYDRMRFGLASALMGNGLYGFDFGDTWHGTDWWYDEWGATTLPKGYLGLPLGEARRVREELPTPNQIRNGGFEVDLSEWDFWVNQEAGASATLSRDTSTPAQGQASARVHNDVPTTSWYVSLQQFDLAIQADVEYTLSFWAKASTDRQIEVILQKQSAPWTGYGLSTSALVTTGWRRILVTFTATATASDAKLVFALGAYPGDTWLDDIKLQVGNLDVWRRDFQGGIVLVNATGQAQTIQLDHAYRRLSGQQAPLDYVIVDDDDPAFFPSGGWKVKAAGDPDFGSTVHVIPAGSRTETATWTPTIAHAGDYTVSVWYRDVPTRATTATYTVNHAAGTTPVNLDFTNAVTGWVPLGVFAFDPGNGGSITLIDAAPSGYLVADAIRLDSVARFNDGTIVQEVPLDPWDGIVLRNCPAADVTGDGMVDVLDLQSTASRWGLTSSDGDYMGLFDLDADGDVGGEDIQQAAAGWRVGCQ